MKDLGDVLVEAARDRVILTVGIATGLTQLVLRLLLARLPPGPWRAEPGFTAHQIVCFPMMVFLTVIGFGIWFHEDPNFDSPDARVLNVHKAGLHMAKIVFAMQAFWDIPTGLLVPSLQEPVMLARKCKSSPWRALACAHCAPPLMRAVAALRLHSQITSVC